MGCSETICAFDAPIHQIGSKALPIVIISHEDKSAKERRNHLLDLTGEMLLCNATMLPWLLSVYDEKLTTVELLVV